ncbi:MAG: hypothetical protein ABIP48_22510 [Planctomycetota bacterium]
MDVRLREDDGDVLRLEAVGGCVEIALLPDLRRFESFLGPGGYSRKVALGLAEIPFLDTFRMSWLLVAHKRFRESGGRLVVHSLGAQLMEFLEVVRFELVLYLAEDEAAALALLRAEDSDVGRSAGLSAASSLGGVDLW